MSNEASCFLGGDGETFESDVLAPEGVEDDSSSINPAFSNRASKDAPTFSLFFCAAKKGLSLDDVVGEDEEESEYNGMVIVISF